MAQLGHRDPPPHVQSNFTTNFVEVGHPRPAKQKTTASTNLLVSITEVTDEDDFTGCEDPVEEFEPGHIDRLVEVLQARAKDIRDGKKKTTSAKQVPGKPNQPDKNRPSNDRPDES